MNLPYEVGFQLIKTMLDEVQEEKLWDVYKLQYPNMTSDTFQTFYEFKKNAQVKVKQHHRVKGKTKEDILKDSVDILRRCGKLGDI